MSKIIVPGQGSGVDTGVTTSSKVIRIGADFDYVVYMLDEPGEDGQPKTLGTLYTVAAQRLIGIMNDLQALDDVGMRGEEGDYLFWLLEETTKAIGKCMQNVGASPHDMGIYSILKQCHQLCRRLSGKGYSMDPMSISGKLRGNR